LKERQVKPQAVAENERVSKNRRALIAEIFLEDEQKIYEVGKGATSATSFIIRDLKCNILCNRGATTGNIIVTVVGSEAA
jgi:hypothetical protein